MDFNPGNPIVKLCLQGMSMEDQGKPEEAGKIFHQAWDEASNDFEKFIAAHYISRHQKNIHDELQWLEIDLQLALKFNDDNAGSFLSPLYLKIADRFEKLGDHEKAKTNYELGISFKDKIFDKGPFYHGTREDLKVGDLLTAGFRSNYHSEVMMNHIYFTALINGAGLAAALAKGNGHEHIYIVEPMGSFENDPNVTDKKFPGNPTRSYRSTEPLKIVGEVKDWVRLTPEELKSWREKLAKTKGQIIN